VEIEGFNIELRMTKDPWGTGQQGSFPDTLEKWRKPLRSSMALTRCL
jgi:hypothetical protein